jgi:hypothetical protein
MSSNTISFSQEVKYEDIYSQIGTLKPQQLFFRLYLYQNQNPHFANTYVQLGYTAEQVLSELDPLRDFELANYWVGNAVLYYSLFSRFLDANEVRRNREFYSNLPIETAGKRIENEDVLSYVNQRSIFFNNYKDSVTLIYKALEKSKDHYNNCVKIFNQINENYDNLNDLLLLTNPTLLKTLESLKEEYSQSIESFNNYKSLINAYPIEGHNQVYKLKVIETYRLDGITNSDFLKDTFDLWDYGKWTKNILQVYNSDIVPLRNEIASIQKMFTDNRRKISLSESIGPDETFASFDDLFLFRLGKYDNNSLVRELFRYLEGRQDFLIIEKSPLNNSIDSTSDLMNRKLRYYHRLSQQLISTEKLLNTYRVAINQERISRFNEFFIQQYGGETGLIRFANQEKQFLDQTINYALNNLNVYLEKETNYRSMLGYSTGARGVSIPLYPVPFHSPDFKTQTYLTKYVFDIQGEPKYSSGSIQRTSRSPMAFVAKVDANKKVEWVREVGAKGRDALPKGDAATHVKGFDQGCMAIVSGNISEDEYSNRLIRLDDKGRDVFDKKIDISAPPVFFDFDDINQICLIGFGNNNNDTLDIYNGFTITKTDSLGNIQWQTQIDLQGQLIDMIRTEGKYLAFFNFISMEINGNKVNAGNDDQHMAHVIVEFSEEGKFIRHTPILSNESFCINRIFSISSNEINLLGYSNGINQSTSEFKYLIITSQGEIIYKNFEDQ